MELRSYINPFNCSTSELLKDLKNEANKQTYFNCMVWMCFKLEAYNQNKLDDISKNPDNFTTIRSKKICKILNIYSVNFSRVDNYITIDTTALVNMLWKQKKEEGFKAMTGKNQLSVTVYLIQFLLKKGIKALLSLNYCLDQEI